MDLPTRDPGRCWQASRRAAGHMPQNDRFKAGQLHVRVPGADPFQPVGQAERTAAMQRNSSSAKPIRGRRYRRRDPRPSSSVSAATPQTSSRGLSQSRPCALAGSEASVIALTPKQHPLIAGARKLTTKGQTNDAGYLKPSRSYWSTSSFPTRPLIRRWRPRMSFFRNWSGRASGSRWHPCG